MPRPKLTERVTLRLPQELLHDLTETATRRGISLNEVALCCFENELSRMSTYRLDYYAQLRAVLGTCQGDKGGRSADLSATRRTFPEMKKVV